jgi:uncharacterized protein YpmB
MKILFVYGGSDEDGEYEELSISDDSDKKLMQLAASENIAPEDCRFYRDLESCRNMLKAIKLAYQAGKNGGELTIIEEKDE